MRIALAISLIGHLTLIGWGVVSLTGKAPLETPPEKRVTVTLAKTSDVRKIRQGVDKPEAKEVQQVKAKDATKPKPEQPKVTKTAPKKADPPKKPKPVKTAAAPPRASAPPPAAPPAPATPSEAKPKPKPVSTVAPQKAAPPRRNPKPRPKPEPVKVAEAKPRETRPKKSQQRTPPTRSPADFDSTALAALINRLPDAEPGRPSTARRSEPQSARVPLEQIDSDWDADIAPGQEDLPPLGQADGRDRELSQNEFDRFIRQIEQCWNPPIGAAGAGDLVPVIGFRLRRDGRIDGFPRVINGSSSPFFRAAADEAIRALKQCQPYDLPAEKYDDWADNEITFDPSVMLGG